MKSVENWRCDVCGALRPDKEINVTRHDFSEEFGMPPGTAIRNVKYCNHSVHCTVTAKDRNRWRFKKKGYIPKIKPKKKGNLLLAIFRALFPNKRREIDSMRRLLHVTSKHLSMVSQEQISLIKRIQLMEGVIVALLNKCQTDSKMVGAFVDQFKSIKKTFDVTDNTLLNLDSALKKLNSKVDYFATDREN